MAISEPERHREALLELQAAAQELLMVGERVIGRYEDPSSVVGQLATGDFGNVEPGSPDGLALTAEWARRLAEDLRVWRANLREGANVPTHPTAAFASTLETSLPMNRKERFFTGTVFPGIVADSGFRNLHVLLELCGIDWRATNPTDLAGVQFWTEYGFAESVYSEADRHRFAGADTARDTPDIVLVGPDWLLAIEAKMYDWPDRGALKTQLDRQAVLVDYWTHVLGMDPARVKHVVLLPEHYATTAGLAVTQPVLTWEAVLDAHREFGPNYWLNVLEVALDRYPSLVSKTKDLSFGQNSDATMTGEEIVAAHSNGAMPYTFVGRQGGLNGPALASDISTGTWRRRSYEVREQPISAANWFAVEAFVEKVKTH